MDIESRRPALKSWNRNCFDSAAMLARIQIHFSTRSKLVEVDMRLVARGMTPALIMLSVWKRVPKQSVERIHAEFI